jgi:hypothetical protein
LSPRTRGRYEYRNSKPDQFFRGESHAFNQNFAQQVDGRSDHPRFKSVSGLDLGISDRPASDGNGCKKSLLDRMIAAGSEAGKGRSDKKRVIRDKAESGREALWIDSG